MYDSLRHLINFKSANNLTDSDIVLLISIFLGLASGIIFGLVDWLFARFTNSNFANLKLRIGKWIYLGITMAIVFGVMTFVSISLAPDLDSIQKLNRDNLILAIVIGLLVPISNQIIDFIFSNNQSKQ